MSRRASVVAGGIAVLLSGLVPACQSNKSSRPPPTAVEPVRRPHNWAVKLSGAGLSNFHRVSKTLYRSAQPSARGMKFLESMGIKTVVNLRWLHSDRDELAGTSMKYVHIRFNTVKPKTSQVVRFLKVVADPKNHPVLVHCKHGADRTGMMVAFYRIVMDMWTKEEAIREMTKGGFNFHAVWKHLLTFIRRADIDQIRTAAGITISARPTPLPPASPRPSPAVRPPPSRPARDMGPPTPVGAMAPKPATPAAR